MLNVLREQLREVGLVTSFGTDLEAEYDDTWPGLIEDATLAEKAGLLHVTAEEVRRLIGEHRVIIVYERENRKFVACMFLQELTGNVVELGTVYVMPAWRYKERKVEITAALHWEALNICDDRGWLAIETSTVHAIVAGAGEETPGRLGTRLALFGELPPDVHKATCCCPGNKTGAPAGLTNDELREWNIHSCSRRDNPCRLIVSPTMYACMTSRRS